MKPTIAFVSGFVLGVMTPVIVFLSVAVLFPGERMEYRLTSDLVLDDVAEFGEFAEESVHASEGRSVIREGRHLFVNVKKGDVNFISIETAITNDTLAAHAVPVTSEIQTPAENGN